MRRWSARSSHGRSTRRPDGPTGAALTASSSMFSADRASPLASRAISGQRLVVDVERLAREPAFAIAERAAEDRHDGVGAEGAGRRPSIARAARR